MNNSFPESLGLYVHFPYCASRCNYCNFVLTTPKQIPVKRYTDAVIEELRTRLQGNSPVFTSLYFGGGTPSLWERSELARFMRALKAHSSLQEGAECTLEANPDEIHQGALVELSEIGINRISLGVQSLNDLFLKRISRSHGRLRALSALDAISNAYRKGELQSFSVDLMYGLPGQNLSHWQAELDELVNRYAPPHLSLYSLTVEPQTMMAHQVKKGRLSLPDDHLQSDMMRFARTYLASLGYIHYEVSSWAKPQHIAKHNSMYWTMRPWLALGAGAHGFIGKERYQNTPRPSSYVKKALGGLPIEVKREYLSDEIFRLEKIITGLRRLDLGLCLSQEEVSHFKSVIDDELRLGRLQIMGERLILSEQGLFFLDDILLRFIE